MLCCHLHTNMRCFVSVKHIKYTACILLYSTSSKQSIIPSILLFLPLMHALLHCYRLPLCACPCALRLPPPRQFTTMNKWPVHLPRPNLQMDCVGPSTSVACLFRIFTFLCSFSAVGFSADDPGREAATIHFSLGVRYFSLYVPTPYFSSQFFKIRISHMYKAFIW